MIGIKGVGMTALAEVLFARGARLSGSDTNEVFYTDAILQKLGISYHESFRETHITPDLDLVVYSSAYSPQTNPELRRAAQLELRTVSYAEALGALSAETDASGVAGVHGKTTTTAMTGTILKNLGLPVTVLVGSQVPSLDYSSAYTGGDKYFVAETCEYRRHFLKFKPHRIIITSIEKDHLDYFKDLDDIIAAFVSYAELLPAGGDLIYCSDDAGVKKAVLIIKHKRPDLKLIPYGLRAEGPFQITSISFAGGKTDFSLRGFDDVFRVHIPGKHSVLNATAAAALSLRILEKEKIPCDDTVMEKIRQGLMQFSGSRRRSEIIGNAAGILFMDDYAHHPTAVRTTLEGLKEYYPERRIVVDFMSHTYSRTKALLHEFGQCFRFADRVILHKIYASAREKDTGTVSGHDLFTEVKKHRADVSFYEEVMDAYGFLQTGLKEGDLFITMGAGNNWQLGKRLFEYFSHQRGVEDNRNE